jgi:hypothetical protein
MRWRSTVDRDDKRAQIVNMSHEELVTAFLEGIGPADVYVIAYEHMLDSPAIEDLREELISWL